MENRFYMLWNPNRNLGTYKHPTPEAANAEARRLANLHPGEKFIVLQAIGHVEKVETTWVEYGEPVPF